jgi:hypothetical protein
MKLNQQACLSNLNINSLFKKETSFDCLYFNKPANSGLIKENMVQAHFPGFNAYPEKISYINQLGKKAFFAKLTENISNSKCDNLNLDNFRLKTFISQIANTNPNTHFNNLNHNKEDENKQFAIKLGLLNDCRSENKQFAIKLGFLNDCRSEKNANAVNSKAEKNLEFSKNLNFNKINFFSSNEKNNKEVQATAENKNLIISRRNLEEKEASPNNFNSSNTASNDFPLFAANNLSGVENENFLLGKKINKISPKNSDAKIESIDNDTDGTKKQPKLIFKNRKYVFTHKNNKAIEDCFKKGEKNIFNTSYRNSKFSQKNNFVNFDKPQKINFFFNFKKEINQNLFLKAPFAICKTNKKSLISDSHLIENLNSPTENIDQIRLQNNFYDNNNNNNNNNNYLCFSGIDSQFHFNNVNVDANNYNLLKEQKAKLNFNSDVAKQ